MTTKGKWLCAISVGVATIVVAELLFCWLLVFSMASVINPLPVLIALAVGIPISGGCLWWALRKPREVSAGRVNSVLLVLQAGIVALLLWPWFVAVEETIIIPDGYMGRVKIVHGVAETLPLERGESGTVIYRIPKTGLLLTVDDEPSQRWIKRRYFYQQENGHLVPISTKWGSTIHNTDSDYLAPTVGIYSETSGLMSRKNGRCKFATQGFIVGTKSYIRSIEGVDDTGEKIHAAGIECSRANRAVHPTR